MNTGGVWVGVLVLMIAATACAALMRLLRSHGGNVPETAWLMLGGLIAGVLLGPTLLGRVMPDHYENWFLGGCEERIQRDEIIRRNEADALAAAHARIESSDFATLRAQHEQERQEATARWRDAQWKDEAPLRGVALFLVACVLLFGGSQSVGRGDHRHAMLTPLTVGLWSAALPGGLVYAAMTGLWDFAAAPSVMVAAALAVGPWMLTALDREAADHAELGGARMVQTAGRVASLIAIAAALWALWSQRGMEGLLIGASLLALPAGWLIGRWIAPAAPLINLICLPALAAMAAVKIELIEDFAFWPLVVILLISDDGRWLGAFCGAMLLGGRRTLRTMRLVIGSMSAGVTQLALLALALHAWALPREVALPILLGTMLIEFTAGMRRDLVQRIAQAEDELRDIADQE